MKRVIYKLLVIFTALLMTPYGAFAQEDAKTKEVIEKVRAVFSQFKSSQDLVKVKNIEKIKNIPDVVDASPDEEHGCLVVTLYNKEKKVFYNPLFEKKELDRVQVYKAADNKRIGKTVWIGNGVHNEEMFRVRSNMLEDLAKRLQDIGFDVTYTQAWNDELAFSSDIVLYHGHGYYIDGLHYINTGIPDKKIDNAKLPSGMIISDPVGWKSKIKNYFLDHDNRGHYYIINENYIKSKKSRMNLNSCVYLACCDLLDDKNDMANVFISKGATAVFAYEGYSTRTAITGAAFLDQLSLGKTISEARDYLETKFDNNWDAQKKYVDNDSEELDFKKTQEKGGDKRKVQYRDEYTKNIVYNDIEGRKELTHLYKLLNGDKWDDAAKKNWCSNQPITTWAGVRVSSTTTGIYVNINSKLQLAEDLKLENFKRIESIFVPEGTTTGNHLTIKDCTMLVNLVNCHANNNLVVSGCPLLQSIDLRGAKTVSISDCDNLAGLALDYAPDVETLSVKNCKKLSSIQCFCSKEHPSKLKHLNIENCDNLYGVTLNGCPDLFGTLDLADCKGLKSLSLTETGIREIKVGYLDELHVRETPIYQTYESIPDWTKHVNGVDPKFVYGSLPKYEDDDKPLDYGDGYKYAGVKDGFFIYYKQNYDDGHGFYHEKEPKDSKYWPEHKTMF